MFQRQQVRQDFGRADIKVELFDTAIAQKGYKVVWEQGMFCSCYVSSGQTDYACPACKGKGYTYINPKNTRVLVTSINGHKEQERAGLNDVGTAYLTPLSTDDVGFRDRFTFLDCTTKYSEVIKRSTTNIDTLKYPALDIIAVRHLTQMYYRGKDFDIAPDPKTGSTNIVWTRYPPAAGTPIALLYVTRPVYICINPIHELRGTYSMAKGEGEEYYVPLSKQFQIKREDFIDNSDLPVFKF